MAMNESNIDAVKNCAKVNLFFFLIFLFTKYIKKAVFKT
jgi:hypothetical protein